MRTSETALALFAALALTVSGFAAEKTETAAEADRPAVRGDGLVVVKDSQTGALRAATAEERAALMGGAARRRVAPAPALPTANGRMANGIRWAVPGPASMSFSVVERGADGKLQSRCVSAQTAEEALEIVEAEGRSDVR